MEEAEEGRDGKGEEKGGGEETGCEKGGGGRYLLQKEAHQVLFLFTNVTSIT